MERKQGRSDFIGKSSDSVIDQAKTFDSQETISEEKTETDFRDNKEYVNTSIQTPLLKQKVTSVMSESRSEKGKRRIVRTSSDSEDFISPTILKSQSM